jgi:hypothetical protein
MVKNLPLFFVTWPGAGANGTRGGWGVGGKPWGNFVGFFTEAETFGPKKGVPLGGIPSGKLT